MLLFLGGVQVLDQELGFKSPSCGLGSTAADFFLATPKHIAVVEHCAPKLTIFGDGSHVFDCLRLTLPHVFSSKTILAKTLVVRALPSQLMDRGASKTTLCLMHHQLQCLLAELLRGSIGLRQRCC